MSVASMPSGLHRRFLLVHGIQHRRPREHWLWWLADALRARGEQVLYPQFPEPEQPSLEAWTELLHAELAQLGDEQRIVVCHSLGCALWLISAQTLPAELRVSRVLLVSPLGEQAFTRANGNEEFRPRHIDPQRLRAATVEPSRVVASTTNPYTPEDARAWSASLGMECDLLADITPSDGYGPWPSVLAWCLRGDVPLTITSG